jgi:hypothetical protein
LSPFREYAPSASRIKPVIRCYKKVTRCPDWGAQPSLDRQAAGSMWDAYCSTTRVKSAIVLSLMVDGSVSRLPHQCAAPSGRQIVIWVGLGTHDCPLRVRMLTSLSNAQGKITPYSGGTRKRSVRPRRFTDASFEYRIATFRLSWRKS